MGCPKNRNNGFIKKSYVRLKFLKFAWSMKFHQTSRNSALNMYEMNSNLMLKYI